MGIQAILVAGDKSASRTVRGTSKAFVELAGKPMVVHVLEALLHTPEVSEVYLVGNPARLAGAVASYGCLALSAARGCPIHIVPQRDSLYANVWYTFLRTLSPGRTDANHSVLVVPADIPLVIPEELSSFVQRAQATGADYVVGLSPESALQSFAPRDGSPGVEMAYFNLREGRFRQNNLHWVRPLQMGNRQYVDEMYENRYQKELWSQLRLAWRVIRREWRNLWVLGVYLVIHVAGLLNRHGYTAAADRVRAFAPLATIERASSALLRTRFRTVTTELGGAAIDVDNEADLEVVEKMLERWKALQVRLARAA
ncbi:MAG TPA: nucleotidyltransferase family protein [Myxococcota bacterium]|nr:nucleotidyltransferase family protein [Myxococcota bacterium]